MAVCGRAEGKQEEADDRSGQLCYIRSDGSLSMTSGWGGRPS